MSLWNRAVQPMPWMVVAQMADAELLNRLETMMWAQVAIAVVMVVCALVVIAGAIAAFLLVRRAMDGVERTRDQVLPHVTPLISRANSIADDVRGVTAGFRRDADAVHEHVHDILDRTRQTVDSLEERVRRFGLVLEVVQEQAEALLMDATATARGVQSAARALREDAPEIPRAARRRGKGEPRNTEEP